MPAYHTKIGFNLARLPYLLCSLWLFVLWLYFVVVKYYCTIIGIFPFGFPLSVRYAFGMGYFLCSVVVAFGTTEKTYLSRSGIVRPY